MRCGCTPASAKISDVSRDLLFCLQKKGLRHWIAGLSAYVGHCKQLLLHGSADVYRAQLSTSSFARLIFLVARTSSRRECR